MIFGRTVIRGERVTLRELTEDDVGEHYVAWMNDAEVMRYLESRFVLHSQDSLRAYVRAMLESPDNVFLAIVLNEDGRHIGNVKLGPIDRNHLIADVGILIGERSSWGKGYATETIRILTVHAFSVLGLRKLTASAYLVNLASVAAFLKAGWQREGVRPGHFLCDGQPVDGVLLGIVRSE